MPAARFRNFRRAAFASPPIFFAMFDYLRLDRSRFGFGDIRPTFRPGGARHDTVDGPPTCWCEPPPCGGLTGFIATPRTLSAGLLRDRYPRTFLPALANGLSRRPAPATTPIVARHITLNVLNWPLGSCATGRSPWLTMTAVVPAARTYFPASPGRPALFYTSVPSGIWPIGTVLPRSMFGGPTVTTWPTASPSGAIMKTSRVPYRRRRSGAGP